MPSIVQRTSKLFNTELRVWGLSLTAAAVLLGTASGCVRREKVLDIQTPAGSVEVNKTTSPSGAKGIEIDTSGNNRIEIDATQRKD